MIQFVDFASEKKIKPKINIGIKNALIIEFDRVRTKRGLMNLLDFCVEEFTTPISVTASENETLSNLNEMMKQFGVRHIPIVKNDFVVGIISHRDLNLVLGLSYHEEFIVYASDIMVANPIHVSAGARLDEVAFEMSQKKIGSVIVNDENDKYYGIFTLTDALNALVEIIRAAQNEKNPLIPIQPKP